MDNFPESLDRLYLMGLACLEDYPGRPQDVQRGIDFLRPPAQRGHPFAQLDLALAHYERRNPVDLDLPGYSSPVPGPSFEEAVHYLFRAAESGLGEALDYLRTLHARGARLLPVPDRGASYLEQVARQAPEPPYGVLRRAALRFETHDPRGSALLRLRAARAGDEDSARALYPACMDFFSGNAGPPDEFFAATCLRAAAEAGVADAQYDLGVAYVKGKGVLRHVALAIAWFEKCGNANSHWALSRIFGAEGGMFPNPELALHHLVEAARLGHAKAIEAIERGEP